MDQLVGAAEIAERLGSNRTTYVHDLRRRHPDFPTPVATLKSGYVWAWPDVEKWARATGRLKGSGGPMPADSNFNRDATSFLGVLIRVVAGFVLIGGVVYGFSCRNSRTRSGPRGIRIGYPSERLLVRSPHS